jgi:2-keto-4-pentenoate hydratase/2-oxohepta-3-ene-1,7-dioic acid hydratase in catechol pathway
MNDERRRFLQQAAAGTVLAASPAIAAVPAQPLRRSPAAPDLPERQALANIALAGDWRLACRTPLGVLDVVGAADDMTIPVPPTIDDLFAYGGGAAVDHVVSRALADPRMRRFFRAESLTRFGPCVVRPQKIIMVGLNYRRHVEEVGARLPETPLLFNKFGNALMGHGGVLTLPRAVAREFDHEVELVIVIGRRAAAVSEAEALSHVAGYCTGNDFSARDLQRVTSQFMLGKSCDGFAPLGPWLLTADLVPDPNALALWCDVNGERRQSSNTADMVFNCAQLVSYASRHMTLEPGDLIFTGTPEGVIAGRPEGQRVWLKPGDTVTCGIEKLGEQTVTLA